MIDSICHHIERRKIEKRQLRGSDIASLCCPNIYCAWCGAKSRIEPQKARTRRTKGVCGARAGALSKTAHINHPRWESREKIATAAYAIRNTVKSGFSILSLAGPFRLYIVGQINISVRAAEM